MATTTKNLTVVGCVALLAFLAASDVDAFLLNSFLSGVPTQLPNGWQYNPPLGWQYSKPNVPQYNSPTPTDPPIPAPTTEAPKPTTTEVAKLSSTTMEAPKPSPVTVKRPEPLPRPRPRERCPRECGQECDTMAKRHNYKAFKEAGCCELRPCQNRHDVLDYNDFKYYVCNQNISC